MTIKNIPVGYKDSPLGIIPMEWEVKRLGEITTQLKTFSFSREMLTNEEQFLMYIHYGDIHKSGEKSKIDLKYERLPFLKNGIVPDYEIKKDNFPLLIDGDIVMPDASEDYNGIGHAWNLQNVGEYKVIGGLHTIAMRPNQVFISIDYSALMFGSYLTLRTIKKSAQGTKVYSISYNHIQNALIPLPPLAEQEKIAEILTTWDKAIEKQTQLIQKLELRKKGLMQQLLTGKKRLPGFTGEWEKVKLGEISKRVTRKNDTNCQNVVTISAQKGFVRQTDFFNKIVASKTTEQYYLVKRDEFCYNKSYSNGFPMGAIKRLVEFEEAVVTTLYICFVIESDVASIDFIEQYFSLGLLNNGLRKVANEGGRAHGLLNVTPYDFFDLKMFLPSLQEQTAIANILSSCDEEIRLAQDKLAAMKEQKKGLMQVLLTGKKRVKI